MKKFSERKIFNTASAGLKTAVYAGCAFLLLSISLFLFLPSYVRLAECTASIGIAAILAGPIIRIVSAGRGYKKLGHKQYAIAAAITILFVLIGFTLSVNKL